MPCFASTDRLDFVLPEFVRLAWTSDSAQSVWAARFQRVLRAWVETELVASAFGVRKCALVTVAGKDLPELEQAWRKRGLTSIELEDTNTIDQPRPGDPSATGYSSVAPLRLGVGASQNVADLQKVWSSGDEEKIGEFLGYPACCRTSFYERCVAGKLIDPTWPMAASESTPDTVTQINVHSSVFTNVLWRSVGIRAVPHLPCRFDCDATRKFGQLFIDVAIQLGFQDEVGWLSQILSWPVEWSALHGIAVIKTPLLKISTRTDATATKLTVRCLGHDYPKEGAQGLMFPYRSPQRTRITESPGFQRGLVQVEP